MLKPGNTTKSQVKRLRRLEFHHESKKAGLFLGDPQNDGVPFGFPLKQTKSGYPKKEKKRPAVKAKPF